MRIIRNVFKRGAMVHRSAAGGRCSMLPAAARWLLPAFAVVRKQASANELDGYCDLRALGVTQGVKHGGGGSQSVLKVHVGVAPHAFMPLRRPGTFCVICVARQIVGTRSRNPKDLRAPCQDKRQF